MAEAIKFRQEASGQCMGDLPVSTDENHRDRGWGCVLSLDLEDALKFFLFFPWLEAKA